MKNIILQILILCSMLFICGCATNNTSNKELALNESMIQENNNMQELLKSQENEINKLNDELSQSTIQNELLLKEMEESTEELSKMNVVFIDIMNLYLTSLDWRFPHPGMFPDLGSVDFMDDNSFSLSISIFNSFDYEKMEVDNDGSCYYEGIYFIEDGKIILEIENRTIEESEKNKNKDLKQNGYYHKVDRLVGTLNNGVITFEDFEYPLISFDAGI